MCVCVVAAAFFVFPFPFVRQKTERRIGDRTVSMKQWRCWPSSRRVLCYVARVEVLAAGSHAFSRLTPLRGFCVAPNRALLSKSAGPSPDSGPSADSAVEVGRELAKAFDSAMQKLGRRRASVPVRDLAARMPEATLEYLGEEHGGLAAFCRALSAAKQPVLSATGQRLQVHVQQCDGVLCVSLSELHKESKREKAEEPVPTPWCHPTPPHSTPEWSEASDYMHRTLSAVLPCGCPVSTEDLMRRWQLHRGEEEAGERVLRLVRTLAEWRAVAGRSPPNGPQSHPSPCERGVRYPTVNTATGEVNRDSAERVRSLLLQSARGDGEGVGAAAESVQWADQIDLVCRHGRVCFAHLRARERGRRWAPPHASGERGANEAEAALPGPQTYDLHRMAVHLTTDAPTPVDTVAELSASATLFHPLQIALVFPERVRVHVSPEAVCRAAAGQEGVESLGWSVLVGPGVHRPIEGLSYTLKEAEKAILSPNAGLARLSLEELHAERQTLRKKHGKFTSSRLRRRYTRELLRRRYPEGNPFLDGEVVAQYLYDHMEPLRWYTNTFLKDEVLPSSGKDTVHVGVCFFQKYPHLFVIRHVRASATEVMRRELDMVDVHGDEALEGQRLTYTKEEIHLWLLTSAFEDAKRHPGHPLHLQLVLSTLPHYLRKAIKQRGSMWVFLKRFLKSHPKVFVPTDVEDKYILDLNEGAVLANELSLSLTASGTVKKTEGGKGEGEEGKAGEHTEK